MNTTKKELFNIACIVYNLMIGNYEKEIIETPYNDFVEDELEIGKLTEKALTSIYENCNMLKILFDKVHIEADIELLEDFLNTVFDCLQDICISAFILSYTNQNITDEEINEKLKFHIIQNKDIKSALNVLYIVAEEVKSKNLVDEIKDSMIFVYDKLIKKMIHYGRKFSGENDLIWLNSYDIDLENVEKRVKKYIDLDVD